MIRRGEWVDDIVHLVRATITFKKTDVVTGLRLTLICMVPIFVGVMSGHAQMGLMCFISALYVVLADVGGTYKMRACSMGVATVGVALAALIATLAGNFPWLAVSLMFLWAFGFGMMGVFGAFGSKVSFVVIGIFIIILGQWSTPDVAFARFLAFIIGGVWATGVSLWFWPFRPYKPVRAAVAAYYRSVQVFTSKACCPTERPRGWRWREATKQERSLSVTAQATAHEAVVSFRSIHEGTSATGQNLLLLVHNADRLFEGCIALAENIHTISKHTEFVHVQPQIETAIQHITDVMNNLANTVEEGHALDIVTVNQALVSVVECQAELREHLARMVDDYAAMGGLRSIVHVLEHITETLRAAGDNAQQLNSGKQEGWRFRFTYGIDFNGVREAVLLLKDNLSPHSLVFRHAMRLAITAASAVALYSVFHIPYGYWISLTILFILKPDFGATRQRAIHRVVGSVLGGIIAAVLAVGIQNEYALYALIIVLGFMTFVHLSGHYGIFAMFLTIFVVLLFDLSTPGDWQIALVRIANTAAGGLMAFAAGYLFMPQWESERLPAQLARAIAANRQFFRAVWFMYHKPELNFEYVRQSSKRAHIENANAAAAFQRVLSEPKDKQGNTERFYALVTYNQRFCDSITTLAQLIPALRGRQELPGLEQFVEQTDDMLIQIEEAVRHDRHPASISSLEDSLLQVRSSIQLLIAKRVAELNAQMITTPSKETILDYALVETQLDRLAHTVSGMVQVR